MSSVVTKTQTQTRPRQPQSAAAGPAASSDKILRDVKAAFLQTSGISKTLKLDINAAQSLKALAKAVDEYFKSEQTKARSENDGLMTKIQKKKKEVTDLTAAMKGLNAQKDKFEKQKTQELKQLKQTLEQEYRELQKSAEQTAAFNKKTLDDQIKTLESENGALSVVAETLREDIIRAQTNAQTLEARIADGTNEIEEISASIAESNKRLEGAQEQLKNRSSELAEANERITATLDDLENAKAKAASAEREKDEKIKELQRATASLTEAESSNTSQADEIARAEKKLEQKNKELELLNRELSEAQKQLERSKEVAAAAAQDQLDEQLQKSADLKAKLKAARDEITYSQFLAARGEGERESLRRKNQEGNFSLNRARERQNRQERDALELQGRVRELSTSNGKLADKISENQSEISSLQQANEEKTQELEALTSKCEKIKRQKDTAEKKARVCADKLVDAEKKIGTLDTAVGEAELHIAVLKTAESTATTEATTCKTAISDFFDSVEVALSSRDTNVFRDALQKVQSAQNNNQRTVRVSEFSDWFLLCVLFGPTKIAVRKTVRTTLKKLSGPGIVAALTKRVLQFGNVSVEQVDPLEENASDDELNQGSSRLGENQDPFIGSESESDENEPREDEDTSSDSEPEETVPLSPPASPINAIPPSGLPGDFSLPNPTPGAPGRPQPPGAPSRVPPLDSPSNPNPLAQRPPSGQTPQAPPLGRPPVSRNPRTVSPGGQTPARERSGSVPRSPTPQEDTSSDEDTALGYYENSIGSVISKTLLQLKDQMPAVKLPSLTLTKLAPPKAPDNKATAYIQFDTDASLQTFVDWPSRLFNIAKYLDATLQTLDRRITVSDSMLPALNVAGLLDNTKKLHLQTGMSPWPVNLDETDRHILTKRQTANIAAKTTVFVEADGLSERALWSGLATISYGIFKQMYPGSTFNFVIQVRLNSAQIAGRRKGDPRRSVNTTGIKAASRKLRIKKLVEFFKENELTLDRLERKAETPTEDVVLYQDGPTKYVIKDKKLWTYNVGSILPATSARRRGGRITALYGGETRFFWRSRKPALRVDWSPWWFWDRIASDWLSSGVNAPEGIETRTEQEILGPNYEDILSKPWPDFSKGPPAVSTAANRSFALATNARSRE